MNKIVTLLFLLSFKFSFSQNPLVKKWDARFGGTSIEWLNAMQQTREGGYVLGGISWSGITGDKTQSCFGIENYWVVKTDALGNKEWDKDFGGTSSDQLYSLQQAADGGYLLGGASMSPVSGNKSQASFSGSNDYWVVKIDSLGNKQWDKDFGGTADDLLGSLKQTRDGGYILGGTAGSGISGNKTTASFGNNDYWIVKIDASGNKQWERDLGGPGWDALYSLQQTRDGGYILGGTSSSGIGGNKTQASFGMDDYWIVKTDSLGNYQWDKDFGGTTQDEFQSLQQTTDGGYILGGSSLSGIDGNKTVASFGAYDYWIIKVDSLGNKQWEKSFGGSGDELVFGNVSQTKDGGYLLAGSSRSSAGGSKTENNLGSDQTWIVKTDSLGNKQWDKTVFTSCRNETGLAIQTKDGCYAFANDSYDSCVAGGYKTQSGWGHGDYWIVKFCDTTQSVLQACLYHSALAGNDTAVTFSLSGGSFQSYGCAPVDPTYWVLGFGATMTMTFTTPQSSPSFRVWGMNDDDSASVMVNGVAYPLTLSSASYDAKVVCGLSPGPDGVVFANGNVVGANSNSAGNYSYQNVTINATGVSSIKVMARSGAGWGFAGVSTNCSSSGTLPVAHFFSSDTAFCDEAGKCIDFTDQSTGNPTSWKWLFPGAVPDTSTQQNPTSICYSVAGTYAVTLIVTNGTGSDTLAVSPMIMVGATPATPTIFVSGDTLTSSHAASYQWYFNGSPISGATDSFYVATIYGNYAVQITDGLGCTRLSAGVFASTNELNGEGGIKVYPNPASNELWVMSDPARAGWVKESRIEIYNVLGEKVYQSEINPARVGEKSEINVGGFAKGVYVVEVNNGNKDYRAKFVKE